MFPKIDPRQMNAMMKQFGIKNEEISAKRVIIETSDKNIVIENPSVMRIDMQGSKSYQISGSEKIEEKEKFGDDSSVTTAFRHSERRVSPLQTKFSEEDVKIVCEKTGKTKEEAEEALKSADGDIAEAIMSLQ